MANRAMPVTGLPEIWAGIECAVTRVGDQYRDQIVETGHERRADDIERLAKLGVTRVRYPVLWERVAPEGLGTPRWSWIDRRLEQLRLRGIAPIAGLLHHGTGPDHIDITGGEFAEEFARFARCVAERYPWLDMYAPINEIGTTARFSGLYGLWHPHARDGRVYARLVLNQCRATVLAMRAVRDVSPHAIFIQMEDGGRVYSTSKLTYQARFENHRRWLVLDLLCGRVDKAHPMWSYLRYEGANTAELEWFLENTCPPDIVGINYYVTSDRFLDHRCDKYPDRPVGSNGKDQYCDIEAVRVRPEGIAGIETPLRKAWARYNTPVAATEVHLACCRVEQMRWFSEAYRAATRLRSEGIDCRAVTAWSVFGAFDWNSLLTVNAGDYECGVYDLRAKQPRPTAMGALIQGLARDGEFEHPTLDSAGWWRRDIRLLRGRRTRNDPGKPASRTRPLVICGGGGRLGTAFTRLCDLCGVRYRLLSRHEVDIANIDDVAEMVRQFRPWAVVNTAGFVRVDEAEQHHAQCFRDNADGPAALAAVCADCDVRLVTFSSDMVFDGCADRPYVESAGVNPLNAYGRSKAEGERHVRRLYPAALVVRTSALFSPWDQRSFLARLRRESRIGRPFFAAVDNFISPTYVPDLVNATLDLLVDGETGIWHLTNVGESSWYEFARAAAAQLEVSARLVPCTESDLNHVAPRPRYTPLTSERAVLLPPIESALFRYSREIRDFEAAAV